MPMKPKFYTIVLLTSLLLAALVDVEAFAQPSSNSPFIFRITSEACNYEPYQRTQTGFQVNDDELIGIVTALHGVADCSKISAISSEGTEITDLTVVKVDVDRDVALLGSPQPDSLSPGGLDIAGGSTVKEDDDLQVIGYPSNLETQLSSKHLSLRGLAKLADLIPADVEMLKYLIKRNSPDLGIEVLSIEGHIVPGHSGAPIFSESGEVVGVGNGGLDLGRIEIAWAVPWQQIEWQLVSDAAAAKEIDRLDALNLNDPIYFVFDLSEQDPVIVAEKTSCQSAIGVKYDTIDEFKDELLLSAKKDAVEELFGGILQGYTLTNDSLLADDTTQTIMSKYVRISGSPVYNNQENILAGGCVSVRVFVKPEDMEALKPKPVESELVCEHNTPNGEDLKDFTKEQAVIDALVSYEPALATLDRESILQLLKRQKYSNDRFNPETGAFCTIVEGDIIPLEIIALLESPPQTIPTPTLTSKPIQTRSVTPVPTMTPTAPVTPTGKLAIPIQQGFEPRVYITAFDGAGVNGGNYIAISQARQPVWSQDGSSIMVNGNIDGIQGLFKLDAIGFNKEVIIDRGSARWPVLSPDGEVIIFSDEALQNLLLRRVPDGDHGIIDQIMTPAGRPFQGKNLVWSDDNVLVFQGCRVWDVDAEGDCGVWITSPIDLAPQKIIDGNYAVPMDAKGGYLTYVMVKDDNWEVFVMPLRGPEDQAVNISNSGAQDGLPAISPDGNMVAYVSNESGNWAIWTATIEGEQKQKWFDIDPQRGAVDPGTWAGDRMSWSR